ncbi:cystatin-like [Rhineura floridana]|uniref:cystatin-like n=1 Tax=Rhineura floridana TaxID=261503 RepID=UPI002AC878CA|nr:cystatin-like [Rhineura floridana]
MVARWLVVCGALLVSAVLATGQRLLGGPMEASMDEEGVQRALQFAMNEYNRGSNDMYASRVSEVIRLRKQIVSGMKYFIDVKVGRTTCRKSVADVGNCAFHEAPGMAKLQICNFVVYAVPWLNQVSLLENNCH